MKKKTAVATKQRGFMGAAWATGGKGIERKIVGPLFQNGCVPIETAQSD